MNIVKKWRLSENLPYKWIYRFSGALIYIIIPWKIFFWPWRVGKNLSEEHRHAARSRCVVNHSGRSARCAATRWCDPLCLSLDNVTCPCGYLPSNVWTNSTPCSLNVLWNALYCGIAHRWACAIDRMYLADWMKMILRDILLGARA